jgi:hypothetical protein
MRNEEYRIRKARAAMLEQRAKLDAVYERHGALFDAIIAAMPAAIVRAEVDLNGLTINVAGDKHILASAIRALRTHGFKTRNEPPATNASSWSAWFEPEHEDHALPWEIRQSGRVYLYFSSTVCRRVKVGQTTRVVTEDVYETVCGETVLPT